MEIIALLLVGFFAFKAGKKSQSKPAVPQEYVSPNEVYKVWEAENPDAGTYYKNAMFTLFCYGKWVRKPDIKKLDGNTIYELTGTKKPE